MNKILWFFITLIIFSLTSCSFFSPVKTEQQTAFVINTLPQPMVKKSSRHITLLVTPPDINSLYRTKDIAYTTSSYQIGYFAKNVWADFPASMIYPLIVQTMQNTHHFHAVVTSASPVSSDYVLHTQIQQLLQDYREPMGVVHFSVRAQLIRTSTNRVVATKEIYIKECFWQKTPFSGVVATNQAVAKMLKQLAEFSVHTI